MNVYVFVNSVPEIGPRQTTAMLIAALVRSGHRVHVADVESISIQASGDCKTVFAKTVIAKSKRVSAAAFSSHDVAHFAAVAKDFSPVEIQPGDSIFIRTNPGRDKVRANQHAAFLAICRVAESLGIRVINSAKHLQFFASKASLLQLDSRYIPASLLSSCVETIAAFARRFEDGCVLKPTSGSRGEGVIRLDSEAPELEVKIAQSLAGGDVICQEFVPQKVPGDKRVVVLNGKILILEGHPAGIERRPAANDFRANLHAGGTAHPLTLSKAEEKAANFAAQILQQSGILLAGVDLIGGRIIELNVFSTGGLFDAERFTQQHFTNAIVSALFET